MPITQGDIIHAQIDEITTSHAKFFIVAGINTSRTAVAVVFINKDINVNVFPTPELQALHYQIHHRKYTFLDKDSWVDCSDYTEFEYEEINDYFIHNPDEARGKLTNDDIQAIHALLGSPENNISRKRKLKFGF